MVGLAAFFSSNVVKPYVDRSVNKNGDSPVLTAVATVPPVTNSAGDQTTAASGALKMVITQQDINNQIAKNAGSFGPVSNVQVQIDTNQFIVTFSAYGMSGRYAGEVVMQNGEPVLANGKVTGALGMFVSTSTVENALNKQIAAAVTKAGVQVNSVALRPGEMVLSLNS